MYLWLAFTYEKLVHRMQRGRLLCVFPPGNYVLYDHTLQLDTTKGLVVKQTQGGCSLSSLRYHIAIVPGAWFLSLPRI